MNILPIDELADTPDRIRRNWSRIKALIGAADFPAGVPDDKRNWVLVFDRDYGKVLWRPLLKWWCTPNITTGAIKYFNSGESLQAGTYRVQYVFGALQYAGPGDTYKINDGSHAYKIRHSDTGGGSFTDVTAPGNSTAYATILDCEQENLSAYLDVTHTGGAISMYLTDSPLGDNTSERPTTFSLERIS